MEAKGQLMQVIPAVFENGVFKPKAPVDLPDDCVVELRVAISVEDPGKADRLKAIYDVLARRHDTGEVDLAARHDEHRP